MGKLKYAKGDTVVRYETLGYVQGYEGDGWYRVLEISTYFSTREYAVRSICVPTRDIKSIDENGFKCQLKASLGNSTPVSRLLESYKNGYFTDKEFVFQMQRSMRMDRNSLKRTIEVLNRDISFYAPALEELEALPIAGYWINISDLRKLKDQNDTTRRAA